MQEPTDAFAVRLPVVIRACREEDLPALEWFGLFAPHRPLIRQVFEEHRRGEAGMLVAEANGEASGQVWVDFRAQRRAGVGVIWALRVLPCLQGLGIGARLVAAAEALLRQHGFSRAELSVETDNPGARRLYERLGYRLVGEAGADDPPGVPDQGRRTQWILSKELAPARAATPGPAQPHPSRSGRVSACAGPSVT